MSKVMQCFRSFSPDGKTISYLRLHEGYSDLCFVAIPPTSDHWCTTVNEHVGSDYSWNQTSQTIAYDNGSKISFYQLSRNKTTVFEFAGSAFDPQFCGSGRLCFSGSANTSEYVIWISNLDGSNATRLNWTGSDYMPQFSPTTNMILYLTNYTGKPEAWVVGANGSLSNVLFQVVPAINGYLFLDTPQLTAASPPSWSPNTDQVLVTGTVDDNTSHIAIASLTLIPVPISLLTYWVTPFSTVKSVTTSVLEAVWSPDGTSILYVSHSSGFYKIFFLSLQKARLASPYG